MDQIEFQDLEDFALVAWALGQQNANRRQQAMQWQNRVNGYIAQGYNYDAAVQWANHSFAQEQAAQGPHKTTIVGSLVVGWFGWLFLTHIGDGVREDFIISLIGIPLCAAFFWRQLHRFSARLSWKALGRPLYYPGSPLGTTPPRS